MDLINRIKNARLIKAIQSDISNVGSKSPTNGGPSATAATFGAAAGRLGDSLRRQQVENMEASVVRDLMRGNKGVQKNVSQNAVANASPPFTSEGNKEMAIEAILKDLTSKDLAEEVAAKYAKAAVPEMKSPLNSWRTPAIKLSEVAAANPEVALGTLAGTGTVGGLALITASGQALADLGNFLAGGQQNQGQRDNVLRS